MINSKFYLFGITVCLTALHLILTWRLTSDIDQMIIDFVFWGALLCLLWRKRDILNLESGILSSFLGLLLIALVFVKSISLFWFESSFLKIVPLMIALGLALLASGIKGLKQYWRELIIALLLCLPESLLLKIIEEVFQVTTLTAKLSVFILWYLGFQVSRQGAIITLSSGSVLVGDLCTGISTAVILLKLSVLSILMFPTNWRKKILVPITAIFIAFVAGGIRVALMAVVVSNHQAFSYWHGSQGNQIFSTIAILIFGVLCSFLAGEQRGRGAGEQRGRRAEGQRGRGA